MVLVSGEMYGVRMHSGCLQLPVLVVYGTEGGGVQRGVVVSCCYLCYVLPSAGTCVYVHPCPPCPLLHLFSSLSTVYVCVYLLLACLPPLPPLDHIDSTSVCLVVVASTSHVCNAQHSSCDTHTQTHQAYCTHI